MNGEKWLPGSGTVGNHKYIHIRVCKSCSYDNIPYFYFSEIVIHCLNKACCFTVEPQNKGHFGANSFVP